MPVLVLVLAAGCRAPQVIGPGARQLAYPTWFTSPVGEQQAEAPVSLDMRLPPHLAPLQKVFALPGWVIYGTVRCLGSVEFAVQGNTRVFTVRDEDGETRIVVDDIYYDVASGLVRAVLAQILADCAAGETELDRKNVLGRHVRRRFGGYVLFTLADGDAGAAEGEARENPLLVSGASDDAMETFDDGTAAAASKVGWRESAGYYEVTAAGDFRYGDPLGTFRQTEEDAIHDLAKAMVLRFSHMQRAVVEVTRDMTSGTTEDVVREQIGLRMRGVRVVRRIVDPARGVCLVTVRVPRDGVALAK